MKPVFLQQVALQLFADAHWWDVCLMDNLREKGSMTLLTVIIQIIPSISIITGDDRLSFTMNYYDNGHQMFMPAYNWQRWHQHQYHHHTISRMTINILIVVSFINISIMTLIEWYFNMHLWLWKDHAHAFTFRKPPTNSNRIAPECLKSIFASYIPCKMYHRRIFQHQAFFNSSLPLPYHPYPTTHHEPAAARHLRRN